MTIGLLIALAAPTGLVLTPSLHARHTLRARAAVPHAGIVDFIASVTGSEFKPVRTMFIAALGDPEASSGTGASEWGIWRIDPGPPGVLLRNYKQELESSNGVAPSGWTFDKEDWWVEEYGRIMEKPSFPIPKGKYVVTGDREVTTVLTIAEDGSWSLDKGTLYDVTHLPCRAARYKGGSPANARLSDFPVTPGATSMRSADERRFLQLLPPRTHRSACLVSRSATDRGLQQQARLRGDLRGWSRARVGVSACE